MKNKCSILIPTQLKRNDLFFRIERYANFSENIEITLSINSNIIKKENQLPALLRKLVNEKKIVVRFVDFPTGPAHVSELMHQSKNKYFVYLADDDDIDLYKLERLVLKLEEHPECTFAYGHTEYSINGKRINKKLKKEDGFKTSKSELPEKVPLTQLLDKWPEQCAVVYKTELVRKITIPSIYSLDLFLMIALYKFGSPLKVNEIVGKREVNTDTISYNREVVEYEDEYFEFANLLMKSEIVDKKYVLKKYTNIYRSTVKNLALYALSRKKLTINKIVSNYQVSVIKAILIWVTASLGIFDKLNSIRVKVKIYCE